MSSEDFESVAVRRTLMDDDDSLGTALRAQVKRTGWFMVSLVGHLVLLVLVILFAPVPEPTTIKRSITITSQITDSVTEDEPMINDLVLEDQKDKTDKTDTAVDINTDIANIDTPQIVLDTNISVDTDIGTDSADMGIGDGGNKGAFQAADFQTVLGVRAATIGNVASNSKLGFRILSRNRKAAAADAGGDEKTMLAADNGLRWLAAHQSADGSWDPRKFDCHPALTTGMTAVSLLAFVGGGNTPEIGEHRNSVKRALKWLIRHQEEDGRLGLHSEVGIVMMALSEAYDLTAKGRLKNEIKDTVENLGKYIAQTQFKCGGWDYFPEPWQTSQLITGWYVLGLKSARLARLKVQKSVYDDALDYFKYSTSNSGYTFITQRVDENTRPDELRPFHRTIGSMSLPCLLFLGIPTTDPKVEACAEKAVTRLPTLDEAKSIDYSYIYYQGLGLILMGTHSQCWVEFNKPMKNTILKLQTTKGQFRNEKGSWAPTSSDPMSWGRVGSTAFATLTMQIYFLYRGTK